MSDQQRIETAAGNCEVLRARLARYEDGEGRPLQSGGVDERAAFEAWAVENHFGTRRPFANSNNYESGYTDFCWKAWQARAALPVREAVADGWQLVPVEPTPEMVAAAEESYMPFGDMDIALRCAMLAAPSPSREGE